jgi:FixJ family two-component response regulator
VQKRDVEAMKAFKGSRIAIVDDDLLVCDTLTEMIQSWGLHAEGFTQPEAALTHIRENKCDVVLLDVFICDVSGLDLITQISDEASNDLKIITITGLADKDTAVRALKLGAYDLLEKPFRNGLLYHSILRALKSLANERELKKLTYDLDRSRAELLAHQQRLEDLNSQLIETNSALSIFTKNIEREREGIEKQIALKLRNLMLPVISKLRNDKALHKYATQLDMLTTQIEDMTSMDFGVAKTLSFTELRVGSLVKSGLTSEEIARQLHIAESTVRAHRKNIRKKLKIDDSHYTLRNFLNSRT